MCLCSGQESEEATSLTPAAPVEVGEDEPDEGQPSLEEALTQLGLTGLTETFQSEQIDFDSLVSELSSCAMSKVLSNHL